MTERRNIAIIAHVDHGKTTLVDALLHQSGTFRANERVAKRALDSNELERERGITILAKCTSLLWRDIRINIVDTPGHADFGGEVERILSMVDGVLLLVDAAEGPMPQTKFVTAKALALGLEPIVVINKTDRSDARPLEAQEEVFDLFAALDASETQLDFPTLFASAKEGWSISDLSHPKSSMETLFELIVDHVAPPDSGDPDRPFAMLVSLLDADPYMGRVLTGRVHRGSIRANMPIVAIGRDGAIIEGARATKLFSFHGLKRVPVEEARAGDIVAIAGLETATVADTICAPEDAEPIPSIPVDPPTLSMWFAINDSPLAGRDGSKVTSRVIRDRLMREAEGNVAIEITENADGESFEVAGRGELQLGILIETMRREGFELSIGRPRVIYRDDPDSGERLEPIEEVLIDVDDAYTGTVVESLSRRKGRLSEMRPSGGGKTRLTFLCPARGLIGFHGELLGETRGTAVMNRLFHSYQPHRGGIAGRRNGVLVSNALGRAVAYALWNLEDRGVMFIETGAEVYPGMIIGEHNRNNDLDVNPLKAKQLTNIRAAGKDDAVRTTPPRIPTLEKALAYINDDELVEITPGALRLRKRHLDPHVRKRAARARQ